MLGHLGGVAGPLHSEGLDSGEPPSQVAGTLGSLFVDEQLCLELLPDPP